MGETSPCSKSMTQYIPPKEIDPCISPPEAEMEGCETKCEVLLTLRGMCISTVEGGRGRVEDIVRH